MSSSGKIIQVASADIVDGTIVNVDVNSAAAIAYAKLNLTGSIVAADLAATAALKKIAEVSGTGSSGVLEFSSIPATYRGLQLIGHGRSDAAVTGTFILMTFETSPTAGAYDYQVIASTGSTLVGAESIGAVDYIIAGEATGASSPASAMGGSVIDIPEYANTSIMKTVLANTYTPRVFSAGNLIQRCFGGTWELTAAIDRIRLTLASGNWTTSSRWTLYGMPA
jgi:hypothetical protein